MMSALLYDVCRPLRCLLTCMTCAPLYDALLYLLCLLTCMQSAQLYNVFLPVRRLSDWGRGGENRQGGCKERAFILYRIDPKVPVCPKSYMYDV